MNAKLLVMVLAGLLSGGSAVNSQKVIQIDISPLLNARPVTTLTHGHLISWTKGIDDNGLSDGYLTRSAALFKGDKGAHALRIRPCFWPMPNTPTSSCIMTMPIALTRKPGTYREQGSFNPHPQG
jgi:hypothetical protein